MEVSGLADLQIGLEPIAFSSAGQVDHEADRRHAEAGRVVGIGMTDVGQDDLAAFKVERPTTQPLRDHNRSRAQN
jgi:hypothetical protein